MTPAVPNPERRESQLLLVATLAALAVSGIRAQTGASRNVTGRFSGDFAGNEEHGLMPISRAFASP
jgi:hypothetical protein